MKYFLRLNGWFFLTFIVGMATPYLTLAQDKTDAVVGVWFNGEKSGKVEIYKSNGTYNGKIVWLRIPRYPEDGKEKVDKNNPDESKRNTPLIGLEILKGFNYNQAESEYVNGTIYDPKSGKTYTCKMWFGDTQDQLKIRGYWGWFFRTETWTRTSLEE